MKVYIKFTPNFLMVPPDFQKGGGGFLQNLQFKKAVGKLFDIVNSLLHNPDV